MDATCGATVPPTLPTTPLLAVLQLTGMALVNTQSSFTFSRLPPARKAPNFRAIHSPLVQLGRDSDGDLIIGLWTGRMMV